MTEPSETSHNQPLGWWATVKTMLAAFFGVQTRRNFERDTQQGSPWRFIVVGIALTLALVSGLAWMVRQLPQWLAS